MIAMKPTFLAVLLLCLPASLYAQAEVVVPPTGLPQEVPVSTDMPSVATGGSPVAEVATGEPPVATPAALDPFGTGFGPGAGLGFGAGLGQAQPTNSFRVEAVPSEHVKGQTANLELLQADLSMAVPLWRDPCNTLLLTAGVRNESLSTGGAFLPLTGQPLPDELWNVRMGLAYRHQFDNGWNAGVAVSVGSASDKPFHSIDEINESINTFLRIPQGEHNAWLFSLSYSPTAQLSFPIPGVAYLWNPSDCFHASIGLPFQVMYRPVDDLTLNFSYVPLTNVRARATYHVYGPLRLYTGFDWENESYWLADRPDIHDRFFYYDKRVSGGLQWSVSEHFLLELSSGYLFDRYYSEGQSTSLSTSNRINIGDGPYLGLQGRLRW